MQVDVFVSKKKKLAHFGLYKPLISYPFFHGIINLVADRWKERKIFFSFYEMIYPKLNGSMKWKNDCIFLRENKKMQREQILEEMSNDLLDNIKKHFPEEFYIIESKGGSFYLMIRKKRGKIVSENRKKMFDKIEDICNCIYNDYSQRQDFILRNYFRYFRLLKHYSNYHFHFLILKHRYFCKYIYSSNYLCFLVLPLSTHLRYFKKNMLR